MDKDRHGFKNKRGARKRLPHALRVSKQVRAHLKNIGQPEPSPFQPDPFQLRAVELIEGSDVIVTAPTGSGKTWIAQKAIEEGLAKGRRVWYASPLKALSNSKYLEFGKIFGEDKVGLLTGDHKLNTDSPVIVGTTEILRNQLYDTLAGTSNVNFDLVILDEAHYLGDSDRGVVWEEVLIYLPPRIRLLLLSATIQNAGDIALWMEANRGGRVEVVPGGKRPVPLIPLCLDGDSMTLSQLTNKTALRARPRVWARQERASSMARRVIEELSALDMLPAIFFLKSRSDCDYAAEGFAQANVPETEERARARAEFIDGFLWEHPEIAECSPIHPLKRWGAAAHHAGHLPYFKLLVEELMSRGLLSAIFATSTVSAGVNFPARTVVIPQSDRFDGALFKGLTATELAQMTGRAGRRGQDLIGFAVLIPGRYMDLAYMSQLFQ
jgi:superfamily II RNA helicase